MSDPSRSFPGSGFTPPCYDYCSPPTSPLFSSRPSPPSPVSLTGLTSLSLFDVESCENKRSPSKRRRDSCQETSQNASLSRLKRKFEEIETFLDIIGSLKKVCPNRAGTQVLEWQKDSIGSAAATLRGVLVDFADELQDMGMRSGVDVGVIAPKCPICLEMYAEDRPIMKFTGCTHATCGVCHNKRRGQKVCPVCRAPTSGTIKTVL